MLGWRQSEERGRTLGSLKGICHLNQPTRPFANLQVAQASSLRYAFRSATLMKYPGSGFDTLSGGITMRPLVFA
jgi:hypothetical protein